ncbi:deoxyribose-phosphate aldolase [Anaerotruncus massiliensis (ex Togo et al. 2019)]|uniref:deoxyribose-phosphate aldolase n=1 Tax=Anaerotruncus massiliensis (ex Togo et al. 2019) TaxID=1673720 RepID=UPI0023F392B6|nr:deoxyribose-phosphate aldolase [Anaerotruncus massiliensis (ex Togo et al. 2019)]
MEKQEIYSHVDHTQLKAVSTWQDIRKLCEEALAHHTASVCIPPSYVARAHERFPALNICTVIGFPLGYNTTAVKVFEAEQAIAEGAGEVDMVVNLGDVKNGDYDKVLAEIAALRRAAGDKVLKVIVETCYLTEEEKIRLCELVTEAGADYIKTSTGFGTGGATLPDVLLFREHIGPRGKIKASGGIRTEADLRLFLENGCDRLGASAAVTALGD